MKTLKIENLGIVAGAVAVAYLLYKSQKAPAVTAGVKVSTTGQYYLSTYQTDDLADNLGLTYL